MLPKYKLLTILYLCQRFGSPSPSVDLFRHLLGTSFYQTLSRLRHEKLISLTHNTGHITDDRLQMTSDSHMSSVSGHWSNMAITYLGTNALLSHYPLLDYFHVGQGNGQEAGLGQEVRLSGGDLTLTQRQNWPPNPNHSSSFTLVVFNIPEEKRQIRDRLRYVLKSAGFGQINRSLYLSPHLTVKEAMHLLSSSGGIGFAFSVPFESFKEIDKEALTKFWDLKEVEELYDEALAVLSLIDNAQLKIDNEKRNSQFSILNSQFSTAVAGRFLSKFLDAFGKDPFLPPLLLPTSPRLGGPNNWPGRKALEVAKEILTG